MSGQNQPETEKRQREREVEDKKKGKIEICKAVTVNSLLKHEAAVRD